VNINAEMHGEHKVKLITTCLLILTHEQNKILHSSTESSWENINSRERDQTVIGETGFSRHTFHFLSFYNFHTNGTEKIMVLVASVILGLCKKIY
jgi:hypothetical protein